MISPAGTFPIAVDQSGRVLFLYVVRDGSTDRFRRFLQDHAPLLRALPQWTLRIVFARPLERLYDEYQTLLHEELEAPLQVSTIAQLKAVFETWKAMTDAPLTGAEGASATATLLRGGRVTMLYRRWLKEGDAAFKPSSSTAIAEALDSGHGSVESLVMPHSYGHLFPLVSRHAAGPYGVEKGAHRGERRSARPQPPRGTPSSISTTSALL